jgi:Gpi18-like mannosyltransferase
MAHLSSAYVLYFLTRGVYVKSSAHVKHVALGAALLHIVSPAGIFLSAPYAESIFSFLNISGFALYLRGMDRVYGHATLIQRLQLVFAGLVFGIATTIRSNGLLSGLPFLYDAIARTWAILNHGYSNRRLYDLTSLIIGGLLVASGLVIPQLFAYRMYCVDIAETARQPWCSRAIPSVYGWVQDHYWYVLVQATSSRS